MTNYIYVTFRDAYEAKCFFQFFPKGSFIVCANGYYNAIAVPVHERDVTS